MSEALIDRVTIIKELPSGNIRLESGADGLYLLFDAECLDCLPFCKAQCCSLNGICLTDDEVEDWLDSKEITIAWHSETHSYEMKRDADGFCNCLDRGTRLCKINEQKPFTCRQFHCTRGALQRGFKLPNSVHRISTK